MVARGEEGLRDDRDPDFKFEMMPYITSGAWRSKVCMGKGAEFRRVFLTERAELNRDKILSINRYDKFVFFFFC